MRALLRPGGEIPVGAFLFVMIFVSLFQKLLFFVA
jgi:hypothetical protein